jgi:NTE family protein
VSILYAASQVRTCQQAALARENLARLREGCTVELVDPVPYEKVRGSGFYRQFVDNAEWPSFMRAGRAAGLVALAALERRLRESGTKVPRQRTSRARRTPEPLPTS